MNAITEKSIKQLLDTENTQVRKLNEIVAQSLREQKLLTHKLRSEKHEKASLGIRIADMVARFGGSWTFIIVFAITISLWVLVNTYFIFIKPFDPYPFILLNLFLSALAAFQAPVILMSQNRQEDKDRQRAEHDYLINLKAELEVRAIHQKIDSLILEQLKVIVESQGHQLSLLDKLIKEKKKH